MMIDTADSSQRQTSAETACSQEGSTLMVVPDETTFDAIKAERPVDDADFYLGLKDTYVRFMLK